MQQLAQEIVFGLLLGGIYVGVAVGFSLIWGVLNIVNLAQGALVIVGSYVTWYLFSRWGIDPFLTLPVDAVVLFAIGYLAQRIVINRIIRAQFLFTFLLTFGLNLVIVNVLLLVFNSNFRSVTTPYSGAHLSVASVVIPYDQLAAAVIGILVAILLAAFLSWTRAGSAIQAVGSDRDAAQLVGVDLRHVYALTFALAAATAGIAGGLISTIQAVSPSSGDPYTLQSFVVVILGGLGRVSATVAGGLLFGLIEVLAQSAPHIGAGFANAIAFAVLVLVLAVRPRGLLGRVG
jgi:branched-chain amino acid transport system permease protein